MSATLLATATSALAQIPDLPRPTPAPGEEEREYNGVPQSYDEWAKIYFQVHRFPKRDFVEIGDGRVRAIRIFTNRVFELVGEDGDYYLVRNLPLEDPLAAGHKAWRRAIQQEQYERRRVEYYEDKFNVTEEPDLYPPFTDRLELVRRDAGLPREGRWQMSFDVADMNGDGRPDLVLPPVRLGAPFPSIALQQADGSWQQWTAAVWPKDVTLDYGTVRVADFDLDGHMDIAIACHFLRAYVLYGNGKGDFTRTQRIPTVSDALTSRALAVGDFDRDGRPDVVLVPELDVDLGSNQRVTGKLVSVALNRASGWALVDQEFNKEIQADWVLAHDLDRDGWDDILLTSRKMSIRKLLWRNTGEAAAFEPIADAQIPVTAYVFANGIGVFDGFDHDDLVMCFEQFNWRRTEPPTQACAVYHFHDAEGRPTLEPRAELFVKKEVEYDNFKGLAVGDIDGDGRDDVAVISQFGELRLFLQYADHTLVEERSPEVDLNGAYLFDVRIADLDGDGRGEIVVMAATGIKNEPGGIWVFKPLAKKWS